MGQWVEFLSTALFYVLVAIIVLGPYVLWLWWRVRYSYHRKQAQQRQKIQAHSVEIEAQDGGGYSVVESKLGVSDSIMSKSINPILQEWTYVPDEVNARRVRDEAGQPRIQLRIDLGILEMAAAGRPDGSQPYGHESLLAYYEYQLLQYREQHRSATGFELAADQCAKLKAEAMQYYYRYLSTFQLGDYHSVLRDTEHNLRLFDLVRDFAAEESDRASLEPSRPYVLMMNTRAQARIALAKQDYDHTLQLITEGVESIATFLRQANQPELIEGSREIQFLQDWAELIRNRPSGS